MKDKMHDRRESAAIETNIIKVNSVSVTAELLN